MPDYNLLVQKHPFSINAVCRDTLESCTSLSRELDLHHFLALIFLSRYFALNYKLTRIHTFRGR